MTYVKGKASNDTCQEGARNDVAMMKARDVVCVGRDRD